MIYGQRAMDVKLLEVRDRHTFASVLAIALDPGIERERQLLARSGFGVSPQSQREYVLVVDLMGDESHTDPYKWALGRTLREAHKYIRAHYDALQSGDVVDVEFILGESATPNGAMT